MDDARNRYLQDRVLTATPAQRVVMIYDRLALDIARARECTDAAVAGPQLGHATSIVAELLSTLDLTAGGPADNLAALYGFLLQELTGVRASGDLRRLDAVSDIVAGLRDAFAQVAAQSAGLASTVALSAASASIVTGASVSSPVRASAWVG